jgi:hypothetical protein
MELAYRLAGISADKIHVNLFDELAGVSVLSAF